MSLAAAASLWVHRLHGTRGLGLGTALLLLAAIAEPGLPAAFPKAIAVLPGTALLAVGLATLPREGVAAQDRALRLLELPHPWRAQLWRLAWLLPVVLLLLPRLFLAAYGIPHLNPLTGVIPLSWTRRIAIAFLFLVMLAPILYLRSSRRYAPGVPVPRPRDVPPGDERHGRRETLLWTALALAALWAWLLRPFWSPFSLLQWPPGLWSLTAGTRGIVALAFAAVPPTVLLMSLTAHLAMLRRLRAEPPSLRRSRVAALGWLHVALILAAAALHAYDLLWIARYESLARF